MKRFELVEEGNVHRVSFADTGNLRSQVVSFMRTKLEEAPGGTMQVGSLAQAVYDEFPNFKVKDLGYAQFNKFADSVKGIRVHGAKRQQVSLVK